MTSSTSEKVSPDVQKFKILFLLDLLHEDADLILGESKTVPLPADLSQAVQVAKVKLSSRSKKFLDLVKNYLRQKIFP